MVYVLGIDLGTSSLKGVLVDQEGKVVASESSEYPLFSEKPGYSEQDPHCWIEAFEIVLNKLILAVPDMKRQLKGISFSGQMHSLVLLDENNEVLRKAILWNDVRTSKQCEEINKIMGSRLIEITGNIALEGFTLPKILWVQENEPHIWEKVAHLMLPKDYLAYWLTGNYSTDYSDGAGTLLLDIKEKQWSAEILQEFTIAKELLPELYESSECVGELSNHIREKFGFTESIPVFAGGADNACAALGAGLTSPNVGLVSIGTSGVFLSNEKNADSNYRGKLHLFNAAMPDRYYSMGVTLSAGSSLSWFRNTFVKGQNFDELLSEVGTVSPGAEGLLFTPYLVGERTPYADSLIRGSFIGLDARHEMKHFSRAVLEGITFSLKDSQEMMKAAKKEPIEYLVSVGGGAKNPAWLQMQADIFDVPIHTLTTEQGPGLGAAILAAVGSGMFETFEECVEKFVSYASIYTPEVGSVEKYKKIYPIYQLVYSATKSICYQLSEI